MSVVKLTKHQLKFQLFLTYRCSSIQKYDEISMQYRLASAMNYRGSYLNSGHYAIFICDEECYMTEFNDTKVSLP